MITKDMMKISAIVGAIIGVFALIPPFIFYACLTLFSFSAIISVLYYRRFDKFELIDFKDTTIKGGMVSIVSFFSFCAIFIPCVLILSLVFKNYYNYGLPYFLNLQALWLFVLILITTSVICALTNGVMLMGLQFFDNLRKEK